MSRTGGHNTRYRKIRRRGQALVEFALLGLLLGMLLAAAVDLGRAYYTAVVVANMAGEGASFAAISPDKDWNYQGAGTCSQFTIRPYDNIQDRAKMVANDRGLVISNQRATISILNEDGTPSSCVMRCVNTPITVKVTYRIDDLFLPGLLGMNNITIVKSSSQRLMRSAYAATCND